MKSIEGSSALAPGTTGVTLSSSTDPVVDGLGRQTNYPMWTNANSIYIALLPHVHES